MMTKDEIKSYAAGDNGPVKDWFLQFMMNLANQNRFQQDITLTVGGFLISGTLIGVRTYFDDLGDYFASSFDSNEGSEQVRVTFHEIGEQCACISPSEKADAPSYIHLKNVRIFNTDRKVHPESTAGALWRGRISEIQGFSLGLI